MKITDYILMAKGWIMFSNPTLAVIAGGLPALKVDVVLGVRSVLICLLCSAVIAGQSGLLAFISTSVGTYLNARSNGNGQGIPQVPAPPVTGANNVT